MTRTLTGIGIIIVALVWSQPFVVGEVPQRGPELVEIAFVANAPAATVVLVDVASRSVVGSVDVNPARVKAVGPGSPNYAQDAKVSPDGRTLYVSRGYVGDVAAFEIASGRMLWTAALNTLPC